MSDIYVPEGNAIEISDEVLHHLTEEGYSITVCGTIDITESQEVRNG